MDLILKLTRKKMSTSMVCVLFLIANYVIDMCHGFLADVEIGQMPKVPPGSPWPMPKLWTKDMKVKTIDKNTFTIISSITECDILDNAVKRYMNIMFPEDSTAHEDAYKTVVEHLYISITSKKCDFTPKYNMIESYKLTVSDHKMAKIEATNVWGALRGLATFSQLIWTTSDEKIQINNTIIEDSPRFTHRGILIDTSRHYIPVAVLLRNLDAMEYNKLNVLHWHMIDDHSFSYQSTTFPELHNKGAYSSYHTYAGSAVSKVIEQARLRGIRVIPEFGTPRHIYSMAHSHPELMIRCNSSERTDDILNPALNTTYTFLKNLYTEIAEVFRDKYIHIGMNDFDISCWKTNDNVTDFMKDSGLVLMSQMAAFYVSKIQSLITDTSKNAIVWEDPLDMGVRMRRSTVMVQVYKNWKRDPIGTVVRQGYRVIDSTWWNTTNDSPDSWKTDYLYDPHDFPGSRLDYDLVVGGEMLHWGIHVGSANFFSSLWPRAASVAERLWSPKNTRDIQNAIFRLEEQRCRMIVLGIPSSPVIPGYCKEEFEGFYRPSSANRPTTSSVAILYITIACIIDMLRDFFTGPIEYTNPELSS